MTLPYRVLRGGPALVLAVLVTLASCSDRETPLRVVAEEEHLSRRVHDLRRLVERAEKGSLLPRRGLVLALGESVVREAVQLSLPREQLLPGGFKMRLEAADVRLRDGHAAARLQGGVSWTGDPRLYSGDVSADLTLFARVEASAPDVRSGTLTVRVVPYGFEIHHLRVGEEQPGTRRLVEALGRALPEALPALSTSVTLPVAVERDLRLAGLEAGPVSIDAATVPVSVSVGDVFAEGGRLFIVLRLRAGRWRRERP